MPTLFLRLQTQKSSLVRYKGIMMVVVVPLPFTQICHSLLCRRKHSSGILILITSVSRPSNWLKVDTIQAKCALIMNSISLKIYYDNDLLFSIALLVMKTGVSPLNHIGHLISLSISLNLMSCFLPKSKNLHVINNGPFASVNL